MAHGLLIHEVTRPNTQRRIPVGRKLLELEDEVTNDVDKCRCLKRGWQMISKCNGSFRWLKIRSQLKLRVSQGKMEYKLFFKYVQDHINFVYKETLFSELHNSCSYLEERTKINTTTRKRQNSILSVFSKIHWREGVKILGASSPGRLYFIWRTPNSCSINISK